MASGTPDETPRAFISHGKDSIALTRLQEFLRALGAEPVVVKDQASLDGDVPQKVQACLSEADFVIVLGTADDDIGGSWQPRGNVLHEIGLAQQSHSGRIIYLLERGAEFPSNIRPKVWEPFSRENLENVFTYVARELVAFGVLRSARLRPPRSIDGNSLATRADGVAPSWRQGGAGPLRGPEPVFVPCQGCGGLGRTGGGWTMEPEAIHSTCRGFGVIVVNEYPGRPRVKLDCNYCEKTGRVEDGWTHKNCPVCGGAGFNMV